MVNRLCDGALAPASQASEVLGMLLPGLIERGISHSSDDVRALCTKQLLGMCKAAGTHIRPHVVKLVPALLETLSVIEDPVPPWGRTTPGLRAQSPLPPPSFQRRSEWDPPVRSRVCG